MRLAALVSCGVSSISPFPTIGCFQIKQVGRVSRMKGQRPEAAEVSLSLFLLFVRLVVKANDHC